MRRTAREQPLAGNDTEDDRSEAELVDALFVENGHWSEPPASWGSPERSFENRQFWEAFEICARLMPVKTARVFVMREVMELYLSRRDMVDAAFRSRWVQVNQTQSPL